MQLFNKVLHTIPSTEEETRQVDHEPIAPVVVAPEEEVPQELEISIEYLPPVFTQVIEDITIEEGKKVTFEAVVEGHEPIEVTWTHDSVEIQVSLECPIDQSINQSFSQSINQSINQ